MKIIMPIDEDKCSICAVLGRAPFFLIADTASNTKELKINPAADEAEGAGLKAAQFIIDSGVDVLITPRCGENSAGAMKAADIHIYKSEGTDAEGNINAFLNNKLVELNKFHSGYHGIR